MKILRLLWRFLRHPIWHYDCREIFRLVREDWDSEWSRDELEGIIQHAEVHSAYRRSGYEQMTSRQRWIFDEIWKRAVERADAE